MDSSQLTKFPSDLSFYHQQEPITVQYTRKHTVTHTLQFPRVLLISDAKNIDFTLLLSTFSLANLQTSC